MFEIKRLSATDEHFQAELAGLTAWESVSHPEVVETVCKILHKVRTTGDDAVLEYTRQLDRRDIYDMFEVDIPEQRLQQALSRTNKDQRKALELAAERIRNYHQRQKQESWQYTEANGNLLGQHIIPLQRVGLYVPGGKATYPSSVLMNAIPAKVAEVNEIIMTVPAPNNFISDIVLAAAAVAGVTRVLTIGGAQAIGALAYGTATVPKVDKIVGTGNIYVATAKNMVFGQVGIDMITGPGELLVICDGDTDPDWIAMDLFTKAEHDEQAQAILVSPNAEFLDAVQWSIARLIEEMPRADIIRTALQTRGALIHVEDLSAAVAVSNWVAPEHLALSVENPQGLLPKIHHAGAIFMGRYTTEALGAYCAGPNHVLPTLGTARYASPLGVYDFQKRSALMMCSEQGAHTLGQIASTLAHGEGLLAHARSAEYRIMQNVLERA